MSFISLPIKAARKPAKKVPLNINPILKEILETKRPTNNPVQNFSFMVALLNELKIDHDVDDALNITVQVGMPNTCFTSHTDTVDNKLGKNTLQLDAEGYLTVKGGGILGADCGSGIYIMLRMIQAFRPGLYVFFATEEQGRIGSEKYRMPTYITKCVSFDRKGTDNLITHQMGEKGCSKVFALAFIERFDLPFKQDPTGSFTDSYSFFENVSECINLSVGYYDQHSKQESQDVVFLEKMVNACINMDWETLPAERVPEPAYTGWGWAKQAGQGDLLDYVKESPEVVVALLEAYGLTVEDCYQMEEEMRWDIRPEGMVAPDDSTLEDEDELWRGYTV